MEAATVILRNPAHVDACRFSRSRPGARATAGGAGAAGADPGVRAINPSSIVNVARSRSSFRRRRVKTVSETSAGGLVVDRSGDRPRAVLIGRLDRRGKLLWSLPKGHVEEGESPEAAARREVEEETGIRGRVLDELGTIDFWFMAEGRRIHKTVHHFLLEAESGELSDADVEVDEVAWVPLEQLHERLAYDSERQLLDRLPDLLAEAR
jgi:ADP-ribose pyrophosphatase YjhB (NUDIX family)